AHEEVERYLPPILGRAIHASAQEIVDAETRAETGASRTGVVGDQSELPHSKRVKEPSAIMVAAYGMHRLSGWDQGTTAKKLGEMCGGSFSQGTISRYVNRVAKWIEQERNTGLPSEKLIPTDPSRLDAGRRPKNYARRKSL